MIFRIKLLCNERCLLNSEKWLHIAASVGVCDRAPRALIYDKKYENCDDSEDHQFADQKRSNEVAAGPTLPCLLVVAVTRDPDQSEPEILLYCREDFTC